MVAWEAGRILAAGGHPLTLIPCACHRNLGDARLRDGKNLLGPRTGWIPVTSTGMRKRERRRSGETFLMHDGLYWCAAFYTESLAGFGPP